MAQKQELSIYQQAGQVSIAQFDIKKYNDYASTMTDYTALTLLDEASYSARAKLLENVKRNGWWASVKNPHAPKNGETFKSFNAWAKEITGLEKAQVDNCIIYAKLVDDNGKCILPKGKGKFKAPNGKIMTYEIDCNWLMSKVVKFYYAVKSDYEDETADYNERVKRMCAMIEDGTISQDTPDSKIKELVERWLYGSQVYEDGTQTTPRISKGKQYENYIKRNTPKPTESAPTESAPTESAPTESAPTENTPAENVNEIWAGRIKVLIARFGETATLADVLKEIENA